MARSLVEQFCKKFGKFTMQQLEDNIGVLCKRVYAEMTADAGGEPPIYARVDFLLDKQGRLWLGERESYGADINGNDETSKMDPTYKELVTKMLSKTKAHLKKVRHAELVARTRAKVSSKGKGVKKVRISSGSKAKVSSKAKGVKKDRRSRSRSRSRKVKSVKRTISKTTSTWK
jgi:hypothetical protein